MSKNTPGRGLLPSTESAFAALWDRDPRGQGEADQRVYDALCGKPFWGTITGLAEHLPKRKR